jgi:hypothetical protein
MALTDPLDDPQDESTEAGWDADSTDDAGLDEPMLVFEQQQQFLEGFDEDDFDEEFDDDFEEEFEDEYADFEEDDLLEEEEEIEAEDEQEVIADLEEPLDEEIDDIAAEDLAADDDFEE